VCASLALREGNILAIVRFKGTTLYYSSFASWSLKWRTFSVVALVGRSWVKRRVGHNFNFGRHREGSRPCQVRREKERLRGLSFRMQDMNLFCRTVFYTCVEITL
jgi:hypothetical protein